ncbi:MAG: hypothetical protein D3904_04095 [Candidatus Electrothrix sp. EH2]|nr:hypothetical protein [Candidatus Electrothrix sp. EH2]
MKEGQGPKKGFFSCFEHNSYELGLGAGKNHQVCAQNKMDIISGNIRSNHIHILVRSPSYLSPAKMMQYLKGKSSYRL